MASEEAEEDGLAALRGNPEGIMLLSKAIDHLTKSSKADIENQKAIEERVEKRINAKNDKAIKDVAKEKGLSKETVDAIRTRILGVKL